MFLSIKRCLKKYPEMDRGFLPKVQEKLKKLFFLQNELLGSIPRDQCQKAAIRKFKKINKTINQNVIKLIKADKRRRCCS